MYNFFIALNFINLKKYEMSSQFMRIDRNLKLEYKSGLPGGECAFLWSLILSHLGIISHQNTFSKTNVSSEFCSELI